jgi:hypothetical protein
MHKGVCWGDPRERGHLEELGLDDKITLKLTFKNWDREAWTVLFWFRKGTGGKSALLNALRKFQFP